MSEKCKACGSYFSTKSNLNQHIRKSCNKGIISATKHQCEHCNKYFSTKSSLTRHINKSCKKRKRKIMIVPKKSTRDALIRSEKQCETLTLALELALKQLTKQKPLSQESQGQNQSQSQSQSQSHIYNALSKIKDVFESKKESVMDTSLPEPDKDNNHSILSDNILETLTNQLGDEESVRFLMTNFLKKHYEKIIDAAYLQGKKSDKYPMACRDGYHFRYLDDNGKLIDDNGGDEIVKVMIYHIQNAVLRVTNLLIKKYVGDSDTNPLYDTFDIGKVQSELCEISKPRIKAKIKKFLSKRVLNPNHPFFDSRVSFMDLREYYLKHSISSNDLDTDTLSI